MTRQNTATRYGSIAKTFHWVTAFLIITLLPLGLAANNAPFSTGEELAFKARLFSIHKTLGVVVFFVALARIFWALRSVKPSGLHPERRLETFAAETVHWLLYGSLVVVPLSGWIGHAATEGFAPIWWPFGQNLPFVPKSEPLAAVMAGLHMVCARLLALSLVLHVAGAIKHHVIDKDATLRRMLPGGVEAGSGAAHRAAIVPVLAALCVWAGALGLGNALGVYQGHSAATEAATLETVQSDWAVQEGQIALSVTQFGSQIEGQFADWTAQITFEPGETPGPRGTVRTVISIGSLTLGSVTEQALGPDFFDTAAHPTAIYEGEIYRQADGYEAVGTLTLKGTSVPLRFPFELTLDGPKAVMRSSLMLDRRAFSIGDNIAEEGSLGFGVAVTLNLTAEKAQ